MLSIIPMPRDKIASYFRGYVNSTADALADAGLGLPDDLHARVESFVAASLDVEGMPVGSTVCDLVSAEGVPVGVAWTGRRQSDIGPILVLHDLRIYSRFRRKGYATAALNTLYASCRAEGGLQGLGLSVLLQNTFAGELFLRNGFRAISQTMVKAV